MELKKRVSEQQSSLIELRRWFHQNPELSYQEINTQQKIIEIVKQYDGLQLMKSARTGLVVDLNPGMEKCLAIRADMDALPINEETKHSFSSNHQGIMHACGHDAHMAILLTLINVLHKIPLKGSVRFIFQPSEENNFNDPEGKSGAARMVEEGVLDSVDAILGFHQRPQKKAFHCAISDGVVMASSDSFQIDINGKASHAGAAPHQGIDAVMIATELIQLFQKIPSRWTDPNDTVVLSVGTINGGTVANIIADQVTCTGTIRAKKMSVRSETIQRIKKIINGLEVIYGADITFTLNQSLPVTENNSMIAQQIRQAARKHLPNDHIHDGWQMMAAEDFSFYGQKIPSCFFFFGTAVNEDNPYGLHHPKMRIMEEALSIPTLIAAEWVTQQLS